MVDHFARIVPRRAIHRESSQRELGLYAMTGQDRHNPISERSCQGEAGWGPALAPFSLSAVWYDMVWYGMEWYGAVWYGMVWYGMVWYGMAWYGMAWHVSGVVGCRGVRLGLSSGVIAFQCPSLGFSGRLGYVMRFLPGASRRPFSGTRALAVFIMPRTQHVVKPWVDLEAQGWLLGLGLRASPRVSAPSNPRSAIVSVLCSRRALANL